MMTKPNSKEDDSPLEKTFEEVVLETVADEEIGADIDSESLVDGIIGVQSYEPEPKKKKAFLPWHRPRKQFVRQYQWKQQIQMIFDEIVTDEKVIKYLGLPGEDLLDLRYFHQEICVPKDIKLKFLGFNSGANANSEQRAELNISIDEVNKLPYIDPSSDVIGDDIMQIGNPESIAWNRSQKMGPFDVINIDLCDGFGKLPPEQFKDTHYNALRQLLSLQSRRPQSWLLFITTRTGSLHVNDEVFERLKTLYGENLKNCADFRNISEKEFSIPDKNTLDTTVSEKSLSDIFIISLCKWISTILIAQNPPSKLELKSVIGYKVDSKVDYEDLISLAIKVTPTFNVANDHVGLASKEKTSIAPNECNIALQVIKRVQKQINVDSILLGDETIFKDMIGKSVTLLEEARYETAEYPTWAQI